MGGFSAGSMFGLSPQAMQAMQATGPRQIDAQSWQAFMPQGGAGGQSNKVGTGDDPFMNMFRRLMGPSSKQVGNDLGEMQGITSGYGPAAPAPSVSDVSGLGSVADGSNPWMSAGSSDLGSLFGLLMGGS